MAAQKRRNLKLNTILDRQEEFLLIHQYKIDDFGGQTY